MNEQTEAPESGLQPSPADLPDPSETAENEEAASISARIIKGFNIALSVLLVGLMLLLGYIMLCSVRGKVVSVFGRCILQVVTGSMEPSIHTGDFIFVEKTDPASLQTGDIITYYSEQSDIYGLLVTHRIHEVREDGTFLTMGDANPVPDALPVRPDQILGRYTGKARLFIMLGTFADARKLILLAVMIAVSCTAFYELRTVMQLGKQVSQERKERLAAEQEASMREAIEREVARLEAEGLPTEQEDQHDTGTLDEAKDGHSDRPV